MEQPAYVVEAIRHCENVANTVESELHEKHQREVDRSQRKSKNA